MRPVQILSFSERLAAEHILKVLNSAVANAEHNDDIPAEELFVSACYADEGPTLKRFRPRARGRAGRIAKRTCHITVIVSRLSDEQLDQLRTKAESRGGSTDAAAARRRRVAKSKADAEAKAAEAEAADSEVEASAVADQPVDDGAAAPVVGPYGEGSHALIDDDPTITPDGFPVKGNADSMLYHNESSPSYGRTKAEVWFASDEAAEAAGFSKPASQAADEPTTDTEPTTDDAAEGDA